MSKTANITSIGVGICVGHLIPIPMAGNIITGAGTISVSSLRTSEVGVHIVLGYCGHVGIIVTGYPSSKGDRMNRGYVGSKFAGVFSGDIVTGCPVHKTGGV